VAQSETPEAYAAAIERALAPADQTYLADARAMARRYDWGRIVPRIRDVYGEALAARLMS
jgi:glycosyltransferase involved in cell wall biosynthesis